VHQKKYVIIKLSTEYSVI